MFYSSLRVKCTRLVKENKMWCISTSRRLAIPEKVPTYVKSTWIWGKMLAKMVLLIKENRKLG